jgi:hypothetical protein
VDRKFFYGIIYKLAPEWLEALIKDCRKLRSLRKKKSKKTKIEGILPFFMDMLLDEPFESNSRMTNQMVLVPKIKRKQRRAYVQPAKIIPTTLITSPTQERTTCQKTMRETKKVEKMTRMIRSSQRTGDAISSR